MTSPQSSCSPSESGPSPTGPGRSRISRFPFAFFVLIASLTALHACLNQPVLVAVDSIRFSVDAHRDHMDNCGLCHADVMADAELSAARRASEESCMACHEEWRQSCDKCHEGTPGIRPEKDRNLIFSHRDHLRRVGGDCDSCHPGVHEQGVPVSTRAVPEVSMPAHEQCFSCHEMQELFDDLKCQSCHVTLSERRLLPMEGFRHSRSFLEEHGEFLTHPQSAQTCAQCHEGNFCLDCHFEDTFILPSELKGEHVSMAFIHPGDFIHRHAIQARTEPDSCSTCHSPSTCEECHTRVGISFRASQSREDGFSFHGPGVNDPTSRDFHGRAARRDILSCASCHDNGMDSNCIDCHRVGGVGGNPHPPGFRSALSRTSADVCRACHIQ